MQDQLYLMAFVKMPAYWKDEINSWFPSEANDRILAIAACAHSEDITLPQIILRHMVAACIRKNNPEQVEITGFINQDNQLKVKLTMSSDEYIALCRILDNYQNIGLNIKNQGWSLSDRRDIELIISRKDLTMVCKNIIKSDQIWYKLHNALLTEAKSFLAPATLIPAPTGAGSSKKPR